MEIKQSLFGKTKDGREVTKITMSNKNGMEADLINYGATLVALRVPGKNGKVDDIVLGYDDVSSYEQDSVYLGATIGRYANRIAEGKFELEGVAYELSQNHGDLHLHGGYQGFHKRLWEIEILADNQVRFSYHSPDLEEGYPGNLGVQVIYTLTDNNEVQIEYEAKTDKTTLINLTNHSYFNLSGMKDNIRDHVVQVFADTFTEKDEQGVPTGEISSLRDHVLDLREPTILADKFKVLEEGYDHNLILSNTVTNLSSLAAKVTHEESGRTLEFYTTEPALQLYTGFFLDGIDGKDGKTYNQYDALCLEAQHYPDSPNHENFPSTVLHPGDVYKQTTIYKFSW